MSDLRVVPGVTNSNDGAVLDLGKTIIKLKPEEKASFVHGSSKTDGPPSSKGLQLWGSKKSVRQLSPELVKLGFELDADRSNPVLFLPLVGFPYFFAERDENTTKPNPTFTEIKPAITGDKVSLFLTTSQGEKVKIDFDVLTGKGVARHTIYKKNSDGTFSNTIEKTETKEVTYADYWSVRTARDFELHQRNNEIKNIFLPTLGTNMGKLVIERANGTKFSQSFEIKDKLQDERRLLGFRVIANNVLELRYRRAPKNDESKSMIRTDSQGKKYVEFVVHSRYGSGKNWDSYVCQIEGGVARFRSSSSEGSETIQELIDFYLTPSDVY